MGQRRGALPGALWDLCSQSPVPAPGRPAQGGKGCLECWYVEAECWLGLPSSRSDF